MRRSTYRGAAAVAVALTGGIALCAPSVGAAPRTTAAAPVTTSPFSAFTTGNVLYANAAQLAAPSAAAAEVAQSAAAAAGGGSALVGADRFGVPTTAGGGTTGYGHGAGANVGLLQTRTIPGQVLLTHVDATSPGSASKADGTLLPVSLAPLATGSVIPGAAVASPTATATTCPTTGTTLSSGTSRAANAQVATVPNLGSLAGVGSTSSTTSTTKLVGASAQGVESQSVGQVAPISLLGGLVTVHVLTPVALTTLAEGTPGTASVSYGAVDASGNPVSATTPVLTVTIDGQSETLTAQDLLGKGLEIGLGVADVTVFAPAHSLTGNETSSPTVAAGGTTASAAADLVRVTVPGTLPAGTGIAGGPLGTLLTGVLGPLSAGLSTLTAPIGTALSKAGVTVADVRAGHLESTSTVPAGGIRCSRAITVPTGPTAPGTNPLGESRKDVAATDVVPGRTFTYDVRVPNRGTGAVTDVTVVDTPSQALDFVSSTPAPSSSSGGTLTYHLGILQPNAVDVITLTFRVPADAATGTVYKNTAVISGTYAGAPVTTTTTVTGPTAAPTPSGACRVAATLFASNRQVAPGEQFAYLIDVQDVGGAACTSVTVTDPVPGGTTFAGCQGTCTHSGSTVTWPIGTLQPGQATVVGLIVKTTATSGTIDDTATATAAGANTVHLATDLPAVTGTSVVNDGDPVPGFSAPLNDASRQLAFTGLSAVVPIVAALLVLAGGAALVVRRRTSAL